MMWDPVLERQKTQFDDINVHREFIYSLPDDKLRKWMRNVQHDPIVIKFFADEEDLTDSEVTDVFEYLRTFNECKEMFMALGV